jgi:hypothetical protein
MDAEMKALVERIARGGPDAIKAAVSALGSKLAAAEAPEPTTRAGWARQEIAEMAAKGLTAVRTRHGFGIYGTGPCDVAGALLRATDKTISWQDGGGVVRRASLTSRKATAHTAPCENCPDHPTGRFNAENERDYCSIHGSRLHDDQDGRWCESCRSS